MRSVKAIRLVVAAATALIAGIVVISQVSAQPPMAKVGSATIMPGTSASVNVEAVDIGSPGLGAWEIGISYDSALVTAVN